MGAIPKRPNFSEPFTIIIISFTKIFSEYIKPVLPHLQSSFLLDLPRTPFKTPPSSPLQRKKRPLLFLLLLHPHFHIKVDVAMSKVFFREGGRVSKNLPYLLSPSSPLCTKWATRRIRPPPFPSLQNGPSPPLRQRTNATAKGSKMKAGGKSDAGGRKWSEWGVETPRSQSRHRSGLLPSCLPSPPLIERPVTDLSLSLLPS